MQGLSGIETRSWTEREDESRARPMGGFEGCGRRVASMRSNGQYGAGYLGHE